MPLSPRVESSCPYKGRFASVMHGSRCRLCKRRIEDPSNMEARKRDEVLGACNTEAALAYGIAARSFFAMMTMGSLALASIAEA
jgi:hypothetical protein